MHQLRCLLNTSPALERLKPPTGFNSDVSGSRVHQKPRVEDHSQNLEIISRMEAPMQDVKRFFRGVELDLVPPEMQFSSGSRQHVEDVLLGGFNVMRLHEPFPSIEIVSGNWVP